MSLKSDLRRQRADVEWLKQRARRRAESRLNIIEIRKEIARRDRAEKARANRPAPQAKPTPQTKPVPPAKSAPPAVSPPTGAPPQPPQQSPAQPPTGSPPVQPFNGQPFYDERPEHLQIRPVHWRQRGPQDYDYEEKPGTNGRCIVDYDPLEDDDDDPFDDD